MKLYDCATAPSPRRVRIFLAEKGVELKTVQVDLAAGVHRDAEFTAVNARGTVPVLELDDGARLTDAASICLYLEEVYPEPNLLGATAKERAVIDGWQRIMEFDGFGAVAECLRNGSKAFQGRALTGPLDYEQIPALAERGRQRVQHFFAALDARLGESEYVAGDRFTAADITAFVSVMFAKVIREMVPETATHLIRWRDMVAARPSIQA